MPTNLEKVLLLQNVDLFSDVTLEHLSYIAAISEEFTVSAGRLLYRQGDAPDGLYIVVSGCVRMLRFREEIERISAGGSFGVWALFDNEPRLATAETVEESRLLFVPREEFYDVLSDHVEMMAGIFRHLVQRLRKLTILLGEKD